jgi:XTP/dITP diphosphohydrolase
MTRGAPAPRWVIATGNPGKLTELRALLEPIGLTLVAQSDLGVESPPETGATFLENALIKARHAAQQTGLAAIADDSGLVVDTLGGAPGIYSARYAGPDSQDTDNVTKLLEAMRDLPIAERGAHFHCVIVALRSAQDPAPAIAQGRWPGRIALEPAGVAGFGYDPVFFDPQLGKTAAELDRNVKNSVSHRGRSLAALAADLARASAAG